MNNTYRSIAKIDFQYAHRFMNWPREAKHLHGHSGYLTLELEDTVDPVTGFAFPCKEATKIAWEVCDHFHHATLFQEGDPLLDAVLKVYEENGIVNDPSNCVPLKKIDHELAWSYPEYRIVVTKKVSTCENLCELFYELLKDKLAIKKVEFRSSAINCASKEF
ncbi:MAG: 6-carboxytetrahydropterin synthase [Oscillospiraceae bacterium]|nr:6-carboxytetrahydropterin synthase [Oscillospiraceae bacterium]